MLLDYCILIFLVLLLLFFIYRQRSTSSTTTLPDQEESYKDEPTGTYSDAAEVLGYDDWSEKIKEELDPQTIASQQQYVQDLQDSANDIRFQSQIEGQGGATYSDWIGLPRKVDYTGIVGDGARQVADVDEEAYNRQGITW